MPKRELAVGTIVSLKSGSPRMTVLRMSEDQGSVVVAWMGSGDDDIRRTSFPIEALVVKRDA